jgi:uncharacterized protein YlxP (DUF503 family)
VIGLLSARLYLRDARSLKDKRQVVRSIMDRLRDQFSVAIAETETQDDHKMITFGIAAVAPENNQLVNLLQTIQEALRRHPVAEYLGGEIQIGSSVV